MTAPHKETPDAGDAGGIRDQVGTGSTPMLTASSDIPLQLRRRREASQRLPALEHSGVSDPLDAERPPLDSVAGCSRNFACLAQPLAKLEAAHHCPCVEAAAAVSGVSAG